MSQNDEKELDPIVQVINEVVTQYTTQYWPPGYCGGWLAGLHTLITVLCAQQFAKFSILLTAHLLCQFVYEHTMGDSIKRPGWPTRYFSLCTCRNNSCSSPDSNPGGLWLFRPHPSIFRQHLYIPSRSSVLPSISWMLPFYICVQTAASFSSMQTFWHRPIFLIVRIDCF